MNLNADGADKLDDDEVLGQMSLVHSMILILFTIRDENPQCFHICYNGYHFSEKI